MKQTGFLERADGYYYAPSIDPIDELDYTLDFVDLLAGDQIAGTPTWTATTGITIVTGKNSNTSTTATVWLKSATLGKTFIIECTVVTTAGRTFNRAFKIESRNL